jgi:hypothetical protein
VPARQTTGQLSSLEAEVYSYFGVYESPHLWFIAAAYAGTFWVPFLCLAIFAADLLDLVRKTGVQGREAVQAWAAKWKAARS